MVIRAMEEMARLMAFPPDDDPMAWCAVCRRGVVLAPHQLALLQLSFDRCKHCQQLIAQETEREAANAFAATASVAE